MRDKKRESLLILRNKAKYRIQVVKKPCMLQPGCDIHGVVLGGGWRLTGKLIFYCYLFIVSSKMTRIWEGVLCLSS